MDAVLRAVADRFQLQPAQLKQKTNAQQIAYPRQIAMYLIKELTHSSLPEIGRMFGGKHHTTVLHSVQKIDKLRQRDADLKQVDTQRNRYNQLMLWVLSTPEGQFFLSTPVETGRSPKNTPFRTSKITAAASNKCPVLL